MKDEEVSFGAAAGDPSSVRPLSLLAVLTIVTSGAALGCGSSFTRTLPLGALALRARAGGDPQSTPRALAVVAFASAQVGKPYCWGGTGPRCFDCSGLATVAWLRAGGARLPRTTDAIAAALPEVSLDDVRTGDILWWPGHVGLYAGDGWMVDAYDSRHGVVRRPARDPYKAFRPADGP